MLDVSLKVRMFDSVLVTMAEARTEEPALPSLVTDTLAAMTAPEPAPLDEVA